VTDYHRPVLLGECLGHLDITPDGTYLDCTMGGGGHSRAILERLGDTGRLLCLDQDEDAIREAGNTLALDPRVTVVRLNFGDLDLLPPDLRVLKFDGILMDLGVSSHMFDVDTRGFSFMADGPLDMRMDRRQPVTAATLLAGSERGELIRLLRTLGEVQPAGRIADALLKARGSAPVDSTLALRRVVESVVGVHNSFKVLSQVFQALRMAVNGELERLEQGLDECLARLRPGGRLAVVSYHSLEDRLVKQRYRDWERDCVCPPGIPLCVCDHRRRVRLVERGGVVPTAAEIADNPRARSARLRVAVKLTEV
jgi:16S rRNA (cytosine1402-N4)-methyltransferase